jgi:hypothetical protein
VACAPEPDPNLPALEDHESDSDDAWSDDDLDGSDVCDVEADASAPATRPPIEDMPDYTGIGPSPAKAKEKEKRARLEELAKKKQELQKAFEDAAAEEAREDEDELEVAAETCTTVAAQPTRTQ